MVCGVSVFSGLLRKDTRLMAISMLVTFLYGKYGGEYYRLTRVSHGIPLLRFGGRTFAAFTTGRKVRNELKAQWEIEEAWIVSEEIQDSSESKIHGDAQNHAPFSDQSTTLWNKKKTWKNRKFGATLSQHFLQAFQHSFPIVLLSFQEGSQRCDILRHLDWFTKSFKKKPMRKRFYLQGNHLVYDCRGLVSEAITLAQVDAGAISIPTP